jgi:hypothetical protein
MSPLRWDVLLVGLLFSAPVLALGLRGDFTLEEVTYRLPWCLLAGWLVVALVRLASAPRTPPAAKPEDPAPEPAPAPATAETEPAATP